MMIGILTFVFGEGSGAVEVAAGNLPALFGDELPPVNGAVSRGSGDKDIVHPRSTITWMGLHSLIYLKKQTRASRQAMR
jgi:hypothetical protein